MIAAARRLHIGATGRNAAPVVERHHADTCPSMISVDDQVDRITDIPATAATE